jgi:hypothetical protein
MISVVILYSDRSNPKAQHQDFELYKMLYEQLVPLINNQRISIWDIKQIELGDNRENAINIQLQQANLILLMLSQNFLNNIWNMINQRIAQIQENKDIRIIPIILRPTSLDDTIFKGTQCLPRDYSENGIISAPESEWETIFVEMCREIKSIIADLENNKSNTPATEPRSSTPTKVLPELDPSPANQNSGDLISSNGSGNLSLRPITPAPADPPLLVISTNQSASNTPGNSSRPSASLQIPPEKTPALNLPLASTLTNPPQPPTQIDPQPSTPRQKPKRTLQQRWNNLSSIKKILLIILVLLIIIASSIGTFAITHRPVPNPQTPQPHQTSTPQPAIGSELVKIGNETITIGISDGSFSFITPDELHAYGLQKGSDTTGEACIYRNNPPVSASHVTIVAVETLSNISSDNYVSFGIGYTGLQGLCQKQIYYNLTHTVKVRILVANIGTEESSVLQQTMPKVTQQIIQLKQDPTFVGVVGFTFSESLRDANNGINTMDQLARAHIPVISTAASRTDFATLWPDYFYRMNPGDSVQGAVAANYAYNTLHKKTAFVFYDPNNVYSTSLEQAFENNFPGIILTTGKITASNSNDFQSFLQSTTQIPDMIYCACFNTGTTPDFSVLHQDLQAYPALSNVTLMGGDGLYDPLGQKAVYQNMYFTAFTFPDTDLKYCTSSAAQCSTEQIDFYATYCKTFAPNSYNSDPANYRAPGHCQSYGLSRPNTDTMLSYDALSTLLWAYDHRKSDAASLLENVVAALPGTRFQGITGWIQMCGNQSSNPINKTVLMIYVTLPSLFLKGGYASVQAYWGEFTPAVSDFSLFPQGNC